MGLYRVQLAQGLDIRLGRIVTSIDYSGALVTVTCRRNEGKEGRVNIPSKGDSKAGSEGESKKQPREQKAEAAADAASAGAAGGAESKGDGKSASDGLETFTARTVIVTLPLGVLKDEVVKFEPTLPPRKLQAIKALGQCC